jgi:hypothetical protein
MRRDKHQLSSPIVLPEIRTIHLSTPRPLFALEGEEMGSISDT